jgi:hypothetical protein
MKWFNIEFVLCIAIGMSRDYVMHNHEKERNLITKIIIMIIEGFPRCLTPGGANFEIFGKSGRGSKTR